MQMMIVKELVRLLVSLLKSVPLFSFAVLNCLSVVKAMVDDAESDHSGIMTTGIEIVAAVGVIALVCMHGHGAECQACSSCANEQYSSLLVEGTCLDDSSDDRDMMDPIGGINGDLEEWSDEDEEVFPSVSTWSFMDQSNEVRFFPRPVGPPRKNFVWDHATGIYLLASAPIVENLEIKRPRGSTPLGKNRRMENGSKIYKVPIHLRRSQI